MYSLLLTIFFSTFLLCFTTYFIFPIVIALLGKIFKLRLNHADVTPFVSVIISAYNEEKDIEQKIKNTLDLDYPQDMMEILIGSDGSSDNTATIVKRCGGQGIHFFDYKVNRGKTSVQNNLVKEAKGEILIFTDAASFLPINALKKMVRNFADNRVGCVAGRLKFVSKEVNITTQSQGVYWRYEVKIREMESQLGRLIGVDGPLYAVRRDCYIPLRPNIISDLMTPLLVLEQGKMVILEPDALVEEEPTQKGSQEFNTRRRITLRGLVGISSHLEVINPLKHPFLSMQIFSHKILRWFVGPLVIINTIAFYALLFYGNSLIKMLAPLYILFFIAAAFGWYCDKLGKKVKFLTVPYYFCLVNLAATFGIVDFFRRKQAVTWETVRR